MPSTVIRPATNYHKNIIKIHGFDDKIQLKGLLTLFHKAIFIFNLSPLTISSFLAMSSGMSQVQLIYLPASQFRFSCVKYTIVSAASSGLSVKTAKY